MTKYNQSSVVRLCVSVIAAVMAASVCGDGYRNPPPTATGIAKSGAHMVFVDDASAISYNPANLADVEGVSIVQAATFARSENTYSPAPGIDIVSDDPWILLPNLYASMPINEHIVAGLGITSPHGQGISFKSGDVDGLILSAGITDPVLHDATLALVNLNPTLAFKIGDRISVGVGADIYLSSLEFKARLPVAPGVILGTKAEGLGWGFGGNYGLSAYVTEKQIASITYRSGVTIDYDGDFSIAGAPAGDFSTVIRYPSSVAFGYGIELTDTIQVEALLEWLEWSVNDIQTIEAGSLPVPPLENNWDDTITVAIGGSWEFVDGLVFRTGYTFIESPIPDATITPILPDTDRHVIGLGLGYSFKGHTLDLSYAFSIYDDKSSPSGSPYAGSYDIDSDLLGLTYSLAF